MLFLLCNSLREVGVGDVEGEIDDLRLARILRAAIALDAAGLLDDLLGSVAAASIGFRMIHAWDRMCELAAGEIAQVAETALAHHLVQPVGAPHEAADQAGNRHHRANWRGQELALGPAGIAFGERRALLLHFKFPTVKRRWPGISPGSSWRSGGGRGTSSGGVGGIGAGSGTSGTFDTSGVFQPGTGSGAPTVSICCCMVARRPGSVSARRAMSV